MYAIGAFLVLLSFAAFKIYVPILGLCTVMPTIAQMTSLVLVVGLLYSFRFALAVGPDLPSSRSPLT